MVYWVGAAERRLKPKEIADLQGSKTCPQCSGHLLRLAERGPMYPYPWVPTGYICEGCNAFVLELGI